MLADADARRHRHRSRVHRGRNSGRGNQFRCARVGPRGRCRAGAGGRRRRHRPGRQRLDHQVALRAGRGARRARRAPRDPAIRSAIRGTTDGPQRPRGAHHPLPGRRRRPGGQGCQLRKPARRRRSRRTGRNLRRGGCRRADVPGRDRFVVGPGHDAGGRQAHRRAGVHPAHRRRRRALGRGCRRAAAGRCRQGLGQHRRDRPPRTARRAVPSVRVAMHRAVGRRPHRPAGRRSRRRRAGRSPRTAAGAAPGSTRSNGRPAEPNSAWGRSCSTRWTTTAPRPVST